MTIAVGDYVQVGPSMPRKRDKWKGTVISIFIDRGGHVVEVHHPIDHIHRCVPLARIIERLPTPAEEAT